MMGGMEQREVVECVLGPCCGRSPANLASAFPYPEDHHGWDCPLADPLGDVIRPFMTPSPNPILEGSRRSLVKRWFGIDVDASTD